MSSSFFSRLLTVRVTGSTNDDLRAALSGPDGRVNPAAVDTWPHLSALCAQTQTAGRGRAEHTWVTPPHGALTVSVVLRPVVPAARLDWLPLLAGLAVQRTLEPRLEGTGWRARTKWPNDVVVLPTDAPADASAVDAPGWGLSRKVAGILCELIPASERIENSGAAGPAGRRGGRERARAEASAVIVGIGVNLAQGAAELPVPWAASLAGLGVDSELTVARGVLEDLGRHLAELVASWEDRDGDPDGGDGELGRCLRGACSTLGQDVVVTTPTGLVRGRAIDVRPGLVLRDAVGGPAGESGVGELVISAGDVASARLGTPTGT